jgi:hypothetical protein
MTREKPVENSSIHAQTPGGGQGQLFQIPFSNQFKASDVTILDTESLNQEIISVAWYNLGDPFINCLLLKTPLPGPVVTRIPLLHDLFTTRRIALYNAKWECDLLELPRDQVIELMQYPYSPKEQYIELASLDKHSSKYLAIDRWGPATYFPVLFHNISCVVKQTLLWLGLTTFALHDFKARVKQQFYATPSIFAEPQRSISAEDRDSMDEREVE